MSDPNDRFVATVKVGSKGQIVIPQAARTMFDIEPGNTLLLLADPDRGIAIVRNDVFNHFLDSVNQAIAEPPVAPES